MARRHRRAAGAIPQRCANVVLAQGSPNLTQRLSHFLAGLRANIKGALVGIESVTAEGLKDVYKDLMTQGKIWWRVYRRRSQLDNFLDRN